MSLVSLAFFSILVNGTLSHPFSSLRGILKKDTLSPFLFIIVAEGLGRMLKAMQHSNQIQGLTLSDGMDPQTHHQFVDDNMLMGPSSV